MKHASQYFQKVLKNYGVHDADRCILMSSDTASSEGFTPFAVVHRFSDFIRVADKYDGKTVRDFSKSDRLFCEPFEEDVDSLPLDRIIDRAGLPREYTRTQKAQAVLMTMAANSVLTAQPTA
jgi:D-alanine-D-alanine ligase-like ATP-grasp enzyme